MMNRKLMMLFAVLLLGAGAMMAKDLRTVVFKVEQLTCEHCEKEVKDNIRFEKGLKKFAIDLTARTVTITYDAEKTNVEQLQAGFKKFKYEAVFIKEKKEE
ncbi:MAG: heavy-metal-associated domain-containing protein [Mediterranea sp.]|jgi:copper chaperone CopZ|nr:heavy-metal-associated domain-containing protein [Mediterranea sp.]